MYRTTGSATVQVPALVCCPFYPRRALLVFGDATQCRDAEVHHPWSDMFKRLAGRFKQMENTSPDASPHQEYRGFVTSITDLKDAQTDACALVCCGVLQSDRDRYFVTGISPPSLARRIFIHIATPLILFALACYGATHISDPFVNQLTSTLLVAFMLLLVVLQVCFKNRWKRVEVRRELLFRKYHRSIATENIPVQAPDFDDQSQPQYLQGQTNCDLHCAHAAVGCYRSDLQRQRNPPNDLCESLAQVFTYGCCCGYHLQVNGMCAVAQEARELNVIIPAERRRLDYITMQHALDYYGLTLSNLSKQLLLWWLGSVVLLIGLGQWLQFPLAHVWIFVATFGHSWLLLWFVHGIWHSGDLSFDLAVKAFSCGFFLSVTLAITWEFLLGMLINIITDIILALAGVQVAIDDNGYEWSGFGQLTAVSSSRDYMRQYGENHPFVYSLILLVKAFVVAAFLEELAKYLGLTMLSDHPDFWTRSELEAAIYIKSTKAAPKSASELETDSEADDDRQEKQPPPAPPLSENLQQLLSKEPKSNASRSAAITITMVAVALGFACFENIIYIFVYSENSLGVGKSMRA